MSKIPIWPVWIIIAIGVFEVVVSRNKRLLDFWYEVNFFRCTKITKSAYRDLALVSGVGFILVGLFGLFILR